LCRTPGAVKEAQDVNLSIQFAGLQELLLKLMAYSSASTRAMVLGMERALIFVHSAIPDYPPKPPTSKYRRTMTLWRSITTRTHPLSWSGIETGFGEVRGYVGTKVKYAHWVIDRDRQAWFHRQRGWWTLQDVIEDNQDRIVVEYSTGYFNALADGLGL
jgi:hypothetical protein